MSKRVGKEPEVIVRDGRPVSVILPIKEYEELLERLEDADDIAYLKKLRSKPLSFRTCLNISPNAVKPMFDIVLMRSAEKDLRRLNDKVHDRIIESISTLAENPRPPGVKKLAGTANDWRIRVGDYRVLHEIAESVRIVRAYRVRHRKDVYE